MGLISKLFGSAERELRGLIREIDINLENNYKEPAHNARLKLGRRTEELYSEGRLSESKYRQYRAVFEEYSEKMKNYRH